MNKNTLTKKIENKFESIIKDKQKMSDHFKDDFLTEAYEAALSEDLPVTSLEDVKEHVKYDVDIDLQTTSKVLAEEFIYMHKLTELNSNKQEQIINDTDLYFELISEMIDSGSFNMIIHTTKSEFNK